MKSTEENHEENQPLFADVVRKKESTIGDPLENKLMKEVKRILSIWILLIFQGGFDLQDL